MRKLVIICGLLLSPFAWGDQSTSSSGNYAMDLGEVVGAVQAYKSMKEICSESFPELASNNDVAYQSWRKRYLPFHQEVEKHRTILLWREANGDQLKYMELLDRWASHIDKYKQGMRKQMSANGSDALYKKCSAYPEYLTATRSDIEHYYAEQVSTIRRGPVKK